MTEWLGLGCFLLPFILAFALSLPFLRRFALHFCCLAPLPALLFALSLDQSVELKLPYVLLGSTLGIDEIGRLFLGVSSLVWLCAAGAALGMQRRYRHQGRFAMGFLLTMGGQLGLCLAMDCVSFYTFFVVMSYSSCILVLHKADSGARYATLVYASVIVLGEMFLLPGIIASKHEAGSFLLADIRAQWLDLPSHSLILLCLLIGFGAKMGTPPLHFWMPLAYTSAPASAAAALSACLVKAGLLGCLRFLPWDSALVLPGFTKALLFLAGMAMILGPIAGILQKEARAVLAYSSVSKMGVLLALFALCLADPGSRTLCLEAILAYTAFHMLNKSALFIGSGLTPHMPSTAVIGWIGLLIATLSFAGLPLLAGALAKVPVQHALANGQGLSFFTLKLFKLSAYLTALQMARFVWLSHPGSAKRGPNLPTAVGAWLFNLLLLLAYPSVLARFGIELAAAGSLGISLSKGLPLALALFSLGVAYYTQMHWRWSLAKGDILQLLYPKERFDRHDGQPLLRPYAAQALPSAMPSTSLTRKANRWRENTEDALTQGITGGVLFILLAALLSLALILHL